MALYRYISPRDFIPNTSASWTLGRKSSGVPMLEHNSNKAADVSCRIIVPIPMEVDQNGIGRALQSITLHHFISATSAGVTPISAGGGTVALYEILLDASKVDLGGKEVSATAGNMAALPNGRASAGYIPAQQVSGVQISPTTLSAAGVAIASLWTSGQSEVFTPGRAPAYEGQESNKTHDYIPRFANTTFVMEISANLGASAVWEIYGATVLWR